MTLKEFIPEFELWVDQTHSLEPASRRYYRNGLRLLRETRLATLRLDAITNLSCDTLAFPGGAATANTALRTLRRMLSQAKERRLISEIPTIKLRKEWERSIAMTQGNAASIAAHMKDGDARDAFLVIRGTGMRPCEAFAMRWEFFNWDALCYQNPRGKTRTARRAVPLLGESSSILKRRHVAQGLPASGWVFPSESNFGHLTSIHKQFTKARDAAGLPREMVLYTARHGAATEMAPLVTLKELMQVLGHSDSKTALRYQHPDTAGLQAKLEAARVQ